MRRGRLLSGLIALVAICAVSTVVPSALADGGTPMDICQDLQDGHLDGTYTPAQLQAFLTDPTVQGYCGPVTVVIPPPPVTTTTTTATPPPAPPVTTKTVTPAPVAVVAAATKTVTTPRVAHVKGSQHTVTTPARSAAAPSTAVRRSGTLPFTGMQLTVFLLVGLGLVATGLVLRSTGKRRSEL